AAGAAGAAGAARAWLDSLYEDGVLALFARQGEEELEALDRAWRQGLAQVRQVWDELCSAYRHWNKRPRAVSGNDNARVVDFDAMVYGREEGFSFPPRADWHPLLLLALEQPGYLAVLGQEVAQAAVQVAEDCPWFLPLSRQVQEVPQPMAATLVAFHLLPAVRAAARAGQQQRLATQAARENAIQELRQELGRTLAPLLLIPEQPDEFARREARSGLAQFQALANRITRLDYTAESFIVLLRQISALQRISFNLDPALDRVDEVEAGQRILLRQNRLGLTGGIVMLLLAIGPAWLPALALGGLAVFAGWRFQTWRQARRELAVQLQLFQRQSSQLIQGGRPREDTPRRTRLAEDQQGEFPGFS
ncbi:MAG: hypothetical protein WBH99_07750, partial [Azovibrio sp.]|uniref:hypothetical protein n=1 Tax=Azovibrio sp. TaxID=1872673 RepID=UPI003C795508